MHFASFKKPEKGTKLYFYNPQFLHSATIAYTSEEYLDVEYFNRRIAAGLAYLSIDAVVNRINFEREQVKINKVLSEF